MSFCTSESSGPQRTVRRSEDGDCGQKTDSDGTREGRSRRCRARGQSSGSSHEQTKVVKMVVDEWFVDTRFGFGKSPTGEVVFIHASVVRGAEVLMTGTDAWAQVVSDDARAQGGSEQEEPGDETRGDDNGARRRRTEWRSK